MSHAGWRSNGKVEMDRREFLAAAGMAGASAAVVGLPMADAQPAADVSGELVACVAGGAWETAFREHMAKPFSQKYPKVKLHLDLSAGTVQLAKLRAARGSNPPFDVVQMLDEQMDIATREGLIDPFTAAEVPNIKTFYAISTPAKWQKDGRYFAAHQNWGQLGIAYPHGQGEEPAQGVARLLEARVQGAGGDAARQLLGRAPVLHRHRARLGRRREESRRRGPGLREDEGAQGQHRPAARRCRRHPAAARARRHRGGPLWDGRAFGLAAAGLPIGFTYPTKPGPVASGAGNGIAKGTQNRAAALKLLDFRFSQEAQKGFCQQMWYGPSNSTVKLDPKYAAKVAYGTEHYSKLLAPNYDVVGRSSATGPSAGPRSSRAERSGRSPWTLT
jgi:Spermidine/putrescine-binding periplasmic protein